MKVPMRAVNIFCRALISSSLFVFVCVVGKGEGLKKILYLQQHYWSRRATVEQTHISEWCVSCLALCHGHLQWTPHVLTVYCFPQHKHTVSVYVSSCTAGSIINYVGIFWRSSGSCMVVTCCTCTQNLCIYFLSAVRLFALPEVT